MFGSVESHITTSNITRQTQEGKSPEHHPHHCGTIGAVNDRYQSLREHFTLRDDVVFLNHGSFGACPAPVFAAYQRWQRELEAESVESLARRFPDLMARTRAALGEYVTADSDEIAFVPNATTALNIVTRALPLQPGDEVLGTDHEYGAIDRM